MRELKNFALNTVAALIGIAVILGIARYGIALTDLYAPRYEAGRVIVPLHPMTEATR